MAGSRYRMTIILLITSLFLIGSSIYSLALVYRPNRDNLDTQLEIKPQKFQNKLDTTSVQPNSQPQISKKLSIDDYMSNWKIESGPGLFVRRVPTCSRVFSGPATADYPQILEKKVFHKTRYILVVGLEGTGHHLIKPLLSNCKNCESPLNISEFTFASKYHRKGLFGSGIEENDVKTSLEKFLDSTDKINEVYEPDAGKTIFLNTLEPSWICGEGSYPNFGGSCREYQYPEARILADLFESLNMDFRIVVLVRNAVDILLSTTIHRRFGKWEENAEFFIKTMENIVLEAQLFRLDKRFLKCIDYDMLPDINEDIGSFIGVDTTEYNLQQEMSNFFHRSKNKEKTENERNKYMNLDVNKTYVKLQTSIDKLKKLCSEL